MRFRSIRHLRPWSVKRLLPWIFLAILAALLAIATGGLGLRQQAAVFPAGGTASADDSITAGPALPEAHVNAPDALRPASGKQLKFGITTQNGVKDADSVARNAGEYPAMIQTYSDFTSRFDIADILATLAKGAEPIITWEPWRMGQGTDQPAYRLRTIIDGSHDAYITAVAGQLVAAGDPAIAIRFAHEMNGYWYPWCELANGNQPGEYVQAWRHVVGIFDAKGLKNVHWIWSPNAPGAGTQDLAGIYPGSRYVTQIGLDAYNFGSRGADKPWLPASALFADGLRALAEVAPDKEILIAETASAQSEGSNTKAAWITDMVQYLDHWNGPGPAKITGFLWFNYNKYEAAANRQIDWRFDSTPEGRRAMKSALQNRR